LKILEWGHIQGTSLGTASCEEFNELRLDHRAVVSVVRSVMQGSEESYAIAR